MQKKFEEIFENASSNQTKVEYKMIGDRPCADIEAEKVEELKQICVPVIEMITGEKVSFTSASTDCNIPLSKGVAAICVGVNNHDGIHTREEWVEKASLIKGLEIAVSIGYAMVKKIL